MRKLHSPAPHSKPNLLRRFADWLVCRMILRSYSRPLREVARAKRRHERARHKMVVHYVCKIPRNIKPADLDYIRAVERGEVKNG